MATAAQLHANIENAKLSTGPRTLEGKLASSRNSLRHGLYASFSALPETDRQQVEEVYAHFSPQFPQREAELLLRELSLAWFRRERVRRMEAAFFDITIQLAIERVPETAHLSRDVVLAGILMDDAAGKRNLDRLHRWERAYSRDIDRTLKALKALPQPEPEDFSPEIAETKPIAVPEQPRPSLNSLCNCGSGRKFKRCCATSKRNSPAGTQPPARIAV